MSDTSNVPQTLTFDEPVAQPTAPMQKPAMQAYAPAASPSNPPQTLTFDEPAAAVTNADSGTTAASQETGVIPAIVRAAKNVVSMPGSIYHSIVNDPANDQEQELLNNGVTTTGGHIPGHVALPLYRIIAQPMQDADAKAATYAQMAENETDPKRKTALLDAAGAYQSRPSSDHGCVEPSACIVPASECFSA